jgi:hypothetical protein
MFSLQFQTRFNILISARANPQAARFATQQKTRKLACGFCFGLVTQAQSFDQCSVARQIGSLQVIQEFSPPAHHFQQASSGVEVFLVLLKVLRQLDDACCQ